MGRNAWGSFRGSHFSNCTGCSWSGGGPMRSWQGEIVAWEHWCLQYFEVHHMDSSSFYKYYYYYYYQIRLFKNCHKSRQRITNMKNRKRVKLIEKVTDWFKQAHWTNKSSVFSGKWEDYGWDHEDPPEIQIFTNISVKDGISSSSSWTNITIYF